jgi:hypothetical protein
MNRERKREGDVFPRIPLIRAGESYWQDHHNGSPKTGMNSRRWACRKLREIFTKCFGSWWQTFEKRRGWRIKEIKGNKRRKKEIRRKRNDLRRKSEKRLHKVVWRGPWSLLCVIFFRFKIKVLLNRSRPTVPIQWRRGPWSLVHWIADSNPA